MSLYELILSLYPNLKTENFINGDIVLQNDSDGNGDYIKEWKYSEPLKKELKGYSK